MVQVPGVKVSLRYKGPDVDSGTMPAEDVIAALQGFTGAYEKLAAESDSETPHQLRVIAVKTGSWQLGIGTFAAVGISDPLKTVETVYKATRWIVQTIGLLIDAKRVAKGRPLQLTVNGNNNTINLIGADGAGTVTMSPDQCKYVQSNMLDADLDKIASPLRTNSIDQVELAVADEERGPITTILATERDYFRRQETIVTKSRETDIDGWLVSLNKENNRGTFRLKDGRAIPYKYAGKNDAAFHREFADRGPVRVACVASLDDSLSVRKIDIMKVMHLQGSLVSE